jgi:dihydroorotate dehydrogenase electron transfer subunit
MLVEFLRGEGVRTLVIVGAMSERDIPLETADSRVTLSFMATRPEVTITAAGFERMGCEVGVVTVGGSKGYVGLPTEMLDRFLHASDGGARGGSGVFTCGPRAMMREVARHAAEHDVRCQVLLEERMGCGIGACMACTCGTRSADGTARQKLVCIDGPVFDASEVIWDEE